MIELLIVGTILGSLLYFAKNWLTHTALNSLLPKDWVEALFDSQLFCVIWDIIMGILSMKLLVLGGGQLAMCAGVVFGIWSVIYIKSRAARKALKRKYREVVDGIIAFREGLPI